MPLVVVAAAILILALVLFGVYAVQDTRKLNREILARAREIAVDAEREHLYEFFKWALDREAFLLYYADMPEVIEREVGPERFHSLLVGWGLPPTNPDLWR
jgi:hypothetical protein